MDGMLIVVPCDAEPDKCPPRIPYQGLIPVWDPTAQEMQADTEQQHSPKILPVNCLSL